MSNITDSAIEYKTYNSRAVSMNNVNSMNKAFRIDRNGNMWAAFYVNPVNINLYYSSDNGFTWNWHSVIKTFNRSNSTNSGDQLFLIECEALEKIYLCTNYGVFYEIDTDVLDREVYEDYLLATVVTDYIPETNEYLTEQERYRDYIGSICGDPGGVFYNFYSKYSNNYLKVAEFSMINSQRADIAGTTELWALSTTESTFTAQELMDSASYNQYCYIVFADLSDRLRFTTFDKLNHVFGSNTLLSSSSLYVKDPSIAVDGNGVLLAAYGDTNGANTDITLRYFISSDSGSSWTDYSIVKPGGGSIYLDNATGDPQLRLSIIGDQGGRFLLSAIFEYDSYPTLFVKTISAAGVQGDWKIVNSKTNKDITGAQFFRPFNDRIQYFGNYANVRMAYQVGFGDDENGDDSRITSVFQESLVNSAFAPDTTTASYDIDPLTSGCLRVDFRVLGDFSTNIDYYDENVTGDFTERYMAAFAKIGIPAKIKKYEVVEGATDTGRGAYAEPAEYTTKILIDPDTYDFPSLAKEDTVFEQFIERDIRKLFFKPDFFMGRTFLVNDGGFVKRTVWTLSYLGNEYEISQIVPRFISNQICFYEANAYVIGPSYDPFRKLTLPSET